MNKGDVIDYIAEMSRQNRERQEAYYKYRQEHIEEYPEFKEAIGWDEDWNEQNLEEENRKDIDKTNREILIEMLDELADLEIKSMQINEKIAKIKLELNIILGE